jgi:hypothetical protein
MKLQAITLLLPAVASAAAVGVLGKCGFQNVIF